MVVPRGAARARSGRVASASTTPSRPAALITNEGTTPKRPMSKPANACPPMHPRGRVDERDAQPRLGHGVHPAAHERHPLGKEDPSEGGVVQRAEAARKGHGLP